MATENILDLNSSLPAIENVLADSLNQKLVLVLELFAAKLNKLGYKNVRAYSDRALMQLPQVDAEKKTGICMYYERLLGWIYELESSGDYEILDEGEMEKKLLEKALSHYGMKIEDDFWKLMTNDLVVEVYGDDMIQLYRSLNFYEFTAYSLMDLSVYEWYVLWERPKMVLELLSEHAQETLRQALPLHTLNVPRHIIREIMSTGQTEPFVPRAGLVDFVHLAALKRNPLGKAVGFLCTSRCQFVVEGEEALNLGFV